MEEKQITPFNEEKVRNYTNILELVVNKGILATHREILSPIRPMFVTNRAGYHNPSVIGEETVITAVTGKKLVEPVWNDVLNTEQDKEAGFKTLCSNKVEKSRVKQNIPDV